MAAKKKRRDSAKSQRAARRAIAASKAARSAPTPRERKAEGRTATNGPARVRAQEAAKPHAPEIVVTLFDRWKTGAQIHALATELGWKRSKVRRTIIGAAGGKEAFRTMRQNGAGGTAEAFGGKRATGGRTAEAVAIDDSKVPTIEKKKVKWGPNAEIHADIKRRYAEYGEKLDTGSLSPMHRTSISDTRKVLEPAALADYSKHWTSQQRFIPTVIDTEEGKMLWRRPIAMVFRAPTGQEYVESKSNERADLILNLDRPLRLRKLEESSVARQLRREEKELERGEVGLERARKTKRDRKAKRTTKSEGTDDE